jgi:hypothetical protein
MFAPTRTGGLTVAAHTRRNVTAELRCPTCRQGAALLAIVVTTEHGPWIAWRDGVGLHTGPSRRALREQDPQLPPEWQQPQRNISGWRCAWAEPPRDRDGLGDSDGFALAACPSCRRHHSVSLDWLATQRGTVRPQ